MTVYKRTDSKRLMTLISSITLVLLITPAINAEESPHWRDPRSCGVQSVYSLLKLSGIDVDYEQLQQLIPITSQGSNISDMSAACSRLGLETDVLLLSPRTLSSIQPPFIAHVSSSRLLQKASQELTQHFVVVLQIDGTYVTILEPTLAFAMRVPRGDFIDQWSGYTLIRSTHKSAKWSRLALLFSIVVFVSGILIVYPSRMSIRSRVKQIFRCCTPLGLLVIVPGCTQEFESPAIANRFEEPQVAVSHVIESSGVLAAGNTHTARFHIYNKYYDRTLFFRIGAISCQCTEAKLQNGSVEGGAYGELKMSVKHNGLAGVFSGTTVVECPSVNWARTFKVRGCNEGVRLTGQDTQWLAAADDERRITGSVFSANDAIIRVTANPVDPLASESFSIGPVVVNEPIQVDDFLETRFSVKVQPDKEARKNVEYCTVPIELTANINERVYTHPINLVCGIR
jgi:predicted double-glycine peptidase